MQKQASWDIIQLKMGGIIGFKMQIDDVYDDIGCAWVVQKAYFQL